MTAWGVHFGDILEVAAEGLICSANVQLNLSGGVGGAILQRYGNEMQSVLHRRLKELGRLNATPGECVLTPSCGTPFRAVVHAVAIDGFYDTSGELVELAYDSAFAILTEQSCRTIVAACLGCGYGRFPAGEFVNVVNRLKWKSFPAVEKIILATTNSDLAEAIRLALAESL